MEGIRQVLCVMTLLAYNLIVCYVLSHQEGDLDFCDEILNAQLMVINVCSLDKFQLNFCTKWFCFFFWAVGGFSVVSKWCVVFILQRTSWVHEREFGRCHLLVQKIMEITKPLATIPSFMFLGIALGQLFEIELEGGRDLCNGIVWKQQMVTYNLHVSEGGGDAHAWRSVRHRTPNRRNINAWSTPV